MRPWLPTALALLSAWTGAFHKEGGEDAWPKEACAERISQETAGMFGIQPQAAAIKDLILAAISGASVEK